MVLDTRLALQAGNNSSLTQGLGNFQNALQNRRNETRRQQTHDVNQEIKQGQLEQQKYEALPKRQRSRLESIVLGAAELDTYLKTGNTEGAKRYLEQRRAGLGSRIASGEQVDTTETDQALLLLEQDPEELRKQTAGAVDLGRSIGIFKTQTSQTGATGALADQLIQEQGNGIDTVADALEFIRGGAGKRGSLAAEIGLGEQANRAKQDGKNRSDLEFKPQINQAAKEAEIIGKGRGEAKDKLESMTANMPKVEAFVSQLNQLAEQATFTKAGRVFDAANRELGREPSEGAVAREKFTAVINNQVLPLLKETFGAAFTVQEGESLRATLGDVNKSPKEKKAALDAFIEAKIGEVESLERRVGSSSQNNTVSALDFLNE